MKRPGPEWRRSGGGGGRVNGRLALGLLLIGTGRAEGFSQFGATRAAYLGSLAPLLGFLIVLAAALAWAGHVLESATAFASGLCVLLAPPVIGEVFCRRWGREERWAQWAHVLNCAQWLILAVLVLLSPLASLGAAFGLSPAQSAVLPVAGLGAYILWFHWFAARHVLELSRGRALAVMAAVVFGTGLLVQGPSLTVSHPPGPAAAAAPGAHR